MAPNIVQDSVCQETDIRVPPVCITDPLVLNNFPELQYGYHSSNRNSGIDTTDEIEVSRQEHITSPGQFELVGYDTNLMVDPNESFLSDAGDKLSPKSDTVDDIFDSDYVLPANTDWWQVIPSEVDESEFDVVDVPHFGDSVRNSGLWEDVDTFVSVVDISGSDVMEQEDFEPVYKLDTRVTTVWGLDIIWEEEETDE